MKTVDRLEVYFQGIMVGTMASYQKYRSAFAYSEDWLRRGFSISPFSLPLQPGVQVAKPDPFDGLFGIFADSLPDGWGRLLVDRMLRKQGERPELINPLTRLSIVGCSGMGGLEYRPAHDMPDGTPTEDLDRLAAECRKILQPMGGRKSVHVEDATDIENVDDAGSLDLLFSMGGSSGGARPKVMIQHDGEEWIVKFSAADDPVDMGQMEYEYNLCAAACGIQVPEAKLFPSRRCAGYFGTKRFDRIQTAVGEEKVHMASVSALLEVSHRIPALDYTSLMALTWQLTKNADALTEMYTRMCFNVFAHNRDDHSNNFSFLCDHGSWYLAPAYDLTYSNSMGGEHATTIAGEGKNPTMQDLLAVAKKAGLKESIAKEIAAQVQDTVEKKLSQYLHTSTRR